MTPRQFFVGRVVGMLILLGVLGLIALLYAFNAYIYKEKQGDGLPDDIKNITFSIGGELVTMNNGIGTFPQVPGTASVRTVRYFGNEIAHDIDADGDMDMVFLVTDDGGGSGTFYYVVGAIQEPDGYRGSEAMFLGDRIAPQSTNAGTGVQVIVNYADRAPGEPMAAMPTVGKSMYVKYDPVTNDFGEVVQNFEGESR